jgi:DNA-binding MltR family transcriptional regulator
MTELPLELIPPDRIPEHDRAEAVAAMLLKESDRGCAIFGAALLADDLEDLLRTFFRREPAVIKKVVNPLFERYAPLSTFSARIQLAYAMCLITNDIRRRLEIVRKLRNDFAHEAGPIDFRDPRCRDRVRLLVNDGKPRMSHEDDNKMLPGVGGATRAEFIERFAFILAVAELSGRVRYYKQMLIENKNIRFFVIGLDRQEDRGEIS